MTICTTPAPARAATAPGSAPETRWPGRFWRRVMRFAIVFQRLALLAARQIGHVGHHQVVARIQQPGRIQQALRAVSARSQLSSCNSLACPHSVAGLLGGQRPPQQLAQRLEAGRGQVVLQAARRVQQAAQQRRLGKAGVQQAQFLRSSSALGASSGTSAIQSSGLAATFSPQQAMLRRGHVGAHAQRVAVSSGKRQAASASANTAISTQRGSISSPCRLSRQHGVHRVHGAQALGGHAHGHQQQEGRHQEVARAAAGVEQLEVAQRCRASLRTCRPPACRRPACAGRSAAPGRACRGGGCATRRPASCAAGSPPCRAR
jgi:hypothetical protein